MLLLKTLLAFPRILQLSSDFGLISFWLGKTHNLPNVNLFASHCQKSQLVIMDFGIFQSIRYHYKMDIQTWCVAMGFEEGKNFFVLLDSLLPLTFRSETSSLSTA